MSENPWAKKFAVSNVEPAPPAREYIRLSQAAGRLGCTVDVLLDKGIRRELDIYAPVLDEGEYVWPVTDRGIPHSCTMGGGAAPVLRARFQRGEYQILGKSDLERIKVGAEIIPEGYICPSITLCLIKDLKDQQAMGLIDILLPEKVVERMQDRAKDVAWIPSRGMNEDMARRPAVGRVLRADMLCLESRDVSRGDAENFPSEGEVQPQVTRSVLHSTKERVNALDHLIDEAIHTAGTTNEVSYVWQKLKNFALEGRDPFTGVFEHVKLGKKTVEAFFYETGVVQPDHSTQKYLTENALRSRLKRRRDKAKSS